MNEDLKQNKSGTSFPFNIQRREFHHDLLTRSARSHTAAIFKSRPHYVRSLCYLWFYLQRLEWPATHLLKWRTRCSCDQRLYPSIQCETAYSFACRIIFLHIRSFMELSSTPRFPLPRLQSQGTSNIEADHTGLKDACRLQKHSQP